MLCRYYFIISDCFPLFPPLASSKSRKERRKMLLLIAAITVHNIPEGLAVGVAFGGNSFESARNLAIAIGLQNFPEGLAVSLPLAASGMGKMEAFWYEIRYITQKSIS